MRKREQNLHQGVFVEEQAMSAKLALQSSSESAPEEGPDPEVNGERTLHVIGSCGRPIRIKRLGF